jgi:hypothetical protein
VAPSDVWPFPELRIALKGCGFYGISDIEHHVVKELQTIPGDQLQECFEQGKHCLSVLTHKGITLKTIIAAS